VLASTAVTVPGDAVGVAAAIDVQDVVASTDWDELFGYA
jgi:hypothetical protein